MSRPFYIALLLTFSLCSLTYANKAKAGPSIEQLKQRLNSIETTLETLSETSIKGGFGPVGISSQQYSSPQHTPWFEVDLGKLTPIDQIVIVPSISQDTQGGLNADGFPIEFTILAGSETNPEGIEIARYNESHHLLPRTAPLVINCAAEASWIRFQASQLSTNTVNGRYILKLAEILVFNGANNVALKRPVRTSPGFLVNSSAQNPQFVTDGFTPYIMNATDERRSKPMIGKASDTTPYSLSIDLGAPYSLTHIHLHALSTSHSVPLYTTPETGIPYHWILEGSQDKDFSNPVELANVRYNSLLDLGPILQHPVKEHPSRYIRFREASLSYEAHSPKSRRTFAFDEIELLSNGENLALGKTFTPNFEVTSSYKIENVTDGHNFYGEILPIRRWLNELASLHDLKMEKEDIYRKLESHYAQQEARFLWMRRTAIALVAAMIISVLIVRMLGLRKIIRMRERIAANLHDELSADLHAVALLGELAQKNIDRKPKLTEILKKIQDLSFHSRHSVRYCMNMLQAETSCEDLIEDMQRTSNRLLSEIDHHLNIEGVEWVKKLSTRKRVDLSLYYKERLINILRHANASTCHTSLTGTVKEIKLDIYDNGLPMSEVPPSLQRRASLLGAVISLQVTTEGQNCLSLTLKTKNLLS